VPEPTTDARTTLHRLPPVGLEDWLRDYYFSAETDLSCSGVEDYSMHELRQLTGLTTEELDAIVFHDSRSLGGPGLRDALGARFAGGHAERVMATHGSSEAIYLILRTLLSPGDEVVALAPIYPQFRGIAEAMGCRVLAWPLAFEDGWRADLDLAEELIGPRTRLVVVNFPHNPTGTTITPAEQDRLLAVVERAGAYLVWDAAFAEITYGAPALPDPVERYERALTLGTLSKCYGLPGLRVGWCLGAPPLLDELVTTRDYLTLALSPLVELIAQRAVEHGDALLAPRRRQAEANRRFLAEWVEAQAGRVEWVPPRGGVSSFVRFPGVGDVESFCHRLVRDAGVLLVPGDCFGEPSFARLGFGCAPHTLRRGLEALSQVLAAAHESPSTVPVLEPSST